MATATGKNRCAICDKERRTVLCEGCSKTFCYNHLNDHRQELSRQLDEVETRRDLFRQTLTEQTSHSQQHPSIEKINAWERESINKIQQTAKEARQLLSKEITRCISGIETQLNKVTDQIRHSREDNDFVETDINQWIKELERLQKELMQPSNITLRRDSVPLINKINIILENSDGENDDISDTSRASSHRSHGRPLSRLRITFDDTDDEDSRYLPSSKQDILEYRNNYPHARSNPRITDNWDFYTNKISSHPDGDFIDNIHKDWYGNYRKLEFHHGYIQWLFPIQEQSNNQSAAPLQKHEIEAIKKDKKALGRILVSYKLMLDFYGFELVDKTTGEIRRNSDTYKDRFRNLNTSEQNYIRITRILKCLGEFDYEYLKFPFLDRILYESIIEGTLSNCLRSCKDYWIETLRIQKERLAIRQYARELLDYRHKGIQPPSTFRATRPPPTSITTKQIKNLSLSKQIDDNDN